MCLCIDFVQDIKNEGISSKTYESIETLKVQ